MLEVPQTTLCRCYTKYKLDRAATINCAGTITKKKMATYRVSTSNLSEGNYLVGGGELIVKQGARCSLQDCIWPAD
jgi:hypothetical protein